MSTRAKSRILKSFSSTAAQSIFTQATSTITTNNVFPIFNGNPNIAGSGGAFTLAFSSNANLTANNDDGGGNGNSEIYFATYNGAAIVAGSVRQVTKTKNNTTTQASTVVFTAGRRLSRDGRWIVFASLAEDPKANSATNKDFFAAFVYDSLSDTFAQVGPRSTSLLEITVTHFPGFTDYTGTTSGNSRVQFSPELQKRRHVPGSRSGPHGNESRTRVAAIRDVAAGADNRSVHAINQHHIN